MSDSGQQEGGSQAAPSPPPAPPPPEKSSSFFWWFALLIIAGGGYYSYQQGWLDEPLGLANKAGGQQEQQQAPVAQAPAPATQQTEPPAPITIASADDLLTQLNAMQSRISTLEGTSRSLQAISEDLAEQVVRTTGGVTPASPDAISELKFDIIDLRLRASGDTQAAIAELEALRATVADDSALGVAINQNVSRLASIPTRSQVQLMISELNSHIGGSMAEIEGRMQALEDENRQAGAEGGILRALFKVQKKDAALEREHALALDLAAAAELVRPALNAGSEDYFAALAGVQSASDSLRDHNTTLHTTEIARALGSLTSVGYPSAYLTLPSSGGAS